MLDFSYGLKYVACMTPGKWWCSEGWHMESFWLQEQLLWPILPSLATPSGRVLPKLPTRKWIWCVFIFQWIKFYRIYRLNIAFQNKIIFKTIILKRIVFKINIFFKQTLILFLFFFSTTNIICNLLLLFRSNLIKWW